MNDWGSSSYNGGIPTGVKNVPQTGSRSGEFANGYNVSGSMHSLQQINTGGYRPSSVLNPLVSSPNGQSADTFERNRALNLYRQ